MTKITISEMEFDPMPTVLSSYSNSYQIGLIIENLELQIPDFMINTLKDPNYVFTRLDMSRGDQTSHIQKTFMHLEKLPLLYFGEG